MEETNYKDYQYDTSKDVLVPFSIYMKLENLVKLAESQGKETVYTDEFSWFNRETHEKLSDKSRSKMKPEDLAKRYYQNHDKDKIEKSGKIQRTVTSTAALMVLPELYAVFHHNVDKGNCIKKETDGQKESV